jgi:hypothetical protein
MASVAFAAGPSAHAEPVADHPLRLSSLQEEVCCVEAPRARALRLSTPPHIHAAPQHVDRRGPTTGGQSGDPGPLGQQLCSILYKYFREFPFYEVG